jgi:PST family polysaccharide transporter
MSDTATTQPTPASIGAHTARLALRNTLWVTLGSYATQLIGFSSHLLLTRLLTPDVFGIFAISNFWASMANLRSKSGLHHATIRQPKFDNMTVGTLLVLEIALASITFAIALVMTFIFSSAIYSSEFRWALIAIVAVEFILALAGPYYVALEREMAMSRLTLVTLFATLVGYLVAIVIAYAYRNIWSLLITSPITALITFIGARQLCNKRLPNFAKTNWNFDRSLASELLRQGATVGLALTTLGTILGQFDNFLIGTFVDSTTLGYYTRAYQMANWPNFILTMVITRVGFVTMSRVQHDIERLTHTTRLSFWVLCIVGLPMMLTIIFGASDLTALLYGERWLPSVTFVRVLAPPAIIGAFMTVAFWLSVTFGQKRVTLFMTLAQALALIVFGTLLTWRFGAYGTVIGVWIAMTVGLAIGLVYIHHRIPLNLKDTFGAPLLGTALTALGLLLVSESSVWSNALPIVRLAFVTIISVVGMWSTMLVLRRTDTLERLSYIRRTWHAN